jgi:hypothetical protein
MNTDDQDKLNRQLDSLKVAGHLVQGWVAKPGETHQEENYGRTLAYLELQLEKTKAMVKEHRKKLMASVALRNSQPVEVIRAARNESTSRQALPATSGKVVDIMDRRPALKVIK